MEIAINFGGFYGFHDEYIEDKIEAMDFDRDYVDFNKTNKDYAKAWIDHFNNEGGTDLKFVEIDSPRFYNFTTDKIIAEVNENDLYTFHEMISIEEFKEWADPQLRSRDGFSSFYNGVQDLIEKSMNDDKDYALLIGMVVDWQTEVGNINDDIYELEYEIIKYKRK